MFQKKSNYIVKIKEITREYFFKSVQKLMNNNVFLYVDVFLF